LPACRKFEIQSQEWTKSGEIMDREPDSATVDAWLAGKLSPLEVAEIEAYFDGQSLEDALAKSRGTAGAEDIDESILKDLKNDQTRTDPVVTDLIREITGNSDAPLAAPETGDWREVLKKSDDESILGYLGNYEVLEVIAVGGMGIVFKAYDPELDRLAALKVLVPDLAANATARQRFLREARAAARLEHENILPIYGVVDDGIPWFAMRYIPGGTLQDRLDAGEVFEIEALKSLARQVAAALNAAHGEGLVHRDIKPANLLLDDDGEHVWVCDFGIARSSDDPTLTYPGAIAGTPKFMSPEQADGLSLDGRSDLYSLGAVLYRCAVGEDILAGETTAAVLRELSVNESTMIHAKQGNLPSWYRNLLNNLLAKDPDHRPESAAAVIRAIDDEYSPPPKHRTRRNRRIAFVATVTLATIIAVACLVQVPAVQHLANRLIAARYDRAFFIADRIGAYPDLRHAIAAASDGDTIELPVDSPILIDKLLIRSGKALTLVSAVPGQRPTLTTELMGVPGLISASPLRLVGLNFEINAMRDGDGIVVVDDTIATLEDCHFSARREVVDIVFDIKSKAIEMRRNASLSVVNCDFDLRDTNAITVLGKSADIRIRNSRIAASYGVDLLGSDSLIEDVKIDVQEQQFQGQSFLRWIASHPPPDLRIEARNCDFVCARPVCWLRSNDVNLVRSRTKWIGSGNTFRLGNGLVQISTSLRVWSAAALLPIEWFDEEANPGEPAVAYLEGTDQTFTDLQKAVDEVPDGSTLLLRGRFEIKGAKAVYTPRGKTLHFRRHPRARERPTVVAMVRKDHALFVFGPTSISGIRFTRYDIEEHALPVLGILAGMEGEVLIEDCEFDARDATLQARQGGAGLSITNTGLATIRRCFFRCHRAIMAAFVDNTSKISNLRIEDCIFTGETALDLNSRVPVADLEISIARSVAQTQSLMTVAAGTPLVPCRLTIEESLLDIQNSMFSIADRPIDAAIGTLVWTGKGNVYSEKFDTYRNPRLHTKAGSYPITTLRSFDELIDRLPGSSDSESTVSPLFDHDKLHQPVTPETLRTALHGSVSSPALELLEGEQVQGQSS